MLLHLYFSFQFSVPCVSFLHIVFEMLFLFLEQSIGSDLGIRGQQALLERKHTPVSIVSAYASRRQRHFYFLKKKFHKERHTPH